jgi:hypothetical protein
MRKTKSILAAVPLLLLWVMLVGMGSGPGAEVPTVEIDFKATVLDDQDISTKMHQASWEGNIFFTGLRGKGVVTISFAKVRKVVSVGLSTGTMKDFQVTLKNGDVVAVSFDVDSRFQGVTDFGTYRVIARNIKEITFE